MESVKRFFSLVIAGLLLVSQLHVTVIIANFYINREAITQELCVNLPKGITSCRGKCQLEKKLDEEKSKKTNQPEIIIEERAPLFFQSLCFSLTKPLLIDTNIKIHYQSNYDFLFTETTFHPPERVFA